MKDYRLSRAERETVLSYDMESRAWEVTTCVPKHTRRLERLYGPGKILDRFGTTRWTLPEAAISIRKPKAVTDAQREATKKLRNLRNGRGSETLKPETSLPVPPAELPF